MDIWMVMRPPPPPWSRIPLPPWNGFWVAGLGFCVFGQEFRV